MNQLLVKAELKNIGFIEAFIATAHNIPHDKRASALIIATEVFDNIAEHALCPISFFPGYAFPIAVRISISCCRRSNTPTRILIRIQNDTAASAC